MNEVEELLRKPPEVVAPAGLAERLKEQIRLPSARTGGAAWVDSGSWLRRWLPAVSVAALLLGCFVVVGVQSGVISGLKRDNADLRVKAQNLDQLRAANVDTKRMQAQSEELARLRRDNTELTQLRTEAEQLRDKVQDAENLRAEAMKRLAKDAGAKMVALGLTADRAEEKDKMQTLTACVNNLKQIGLAARSWDLDHNGIEPTNYLSMTNVLWTPKILICPSDKAHTVAVDWDHLTEDNISYPMVSPGVLETIPHAVYAYCPIHHVYLLAEGSVRVLTPEQEKTQIKVVNGITMYVP